MFTLKIIIAGVVRLIEPGVTFERWRKLAPSIEPMIPDLTIPGRVVMVAETEDGVAHILGRWR